MSNSPKMQNDVQVERVETGKLVPYARNARTHSEAQVQQIAGSIREFGFTNPVLIDDENGIIAGHGRVLAAQLLGLADVPCIRLSHLNETQRRAYVLADNRIALNSGWDDAMLAIELAELQIDGIDLGALGFDDDDLTALGVGVDEIAFPELASGPKGDFEQVAFSMHTVQAAEVRRAMDIARLQGDFTDGLNPNGNANAITRVAQFYIEAHQ
jgi:hypothetical protein